MTASSDFTFLDGLIVGQAGATGPTGPAGPQGAAGGVVYTNFPSGLSLIPGFTGARGPTGPTGPAGPTGPTGPRGATGVQGVAGDVGVTGPAGATGVRGATGVAGATGPTGPAGAQGATGAQGQMGETGAGGPAAGPRGAIQFNVGSGGFTGTTGVAVPGNFAIGLGATYAATGNIRGGPTFAIKTVHSATGGSDQSLVELSGQNQITFALGFNETKIAGNQVTLTGTEITFQAALQRWPVSSTVVIDHTSQGTGPATSFTIEAQTAVQSGYTGGVLDIIAGAGATGSGSGLVRLRANRDGTTKPIILQGGATGATATIGALGAAPVPRQVISGAGATAVFNSLISALVALGFVTDARS